MNKTAKIILSIVIWPIGAFYVCKFLWEQYEAKKKEVVAGREQKLVEFQKNCTIESHTKAGLRWSKWTKHCFICGDYVAQLGKRDFAIGTICVDCSKKQPAKWKSQYEKRRQAKDYQGLEELIQIAKSETHEESGLLINDEPGLRSKFCPNCNKDVPITGGMGGVDLAIGFVLCCAALVPGMLWFMLMRKPMYCAICKTELK